MNEEFYSFPSDLLHKIKSGHIVLVNLLFEIKVSFKNLLKSHGLIHPELYPVYQQYLDFLLELEIHFAKEAVAVLPFVRRYTEELNKKLCNRKPRIFSACASIDLMYHEHRKEELQFNLLFEKFKSIHIDEGSPHFTRTCQKLQIFKDLWQEQIHVEDDILFPGIIEMESLLNPLET